MGYLEQGMQSLVSRPDLTAATPRLSAPLAAERLSSPQPPAVIDVRSPRERDQKHIAGSVSMPLNRLAESLDKLPRGLPLLVYCAGGYRSSIAASLLKRRDFTDVSEIAGGLAAWEAAGLPVQIPG
jgi:rhodanese-related sulfurtransferase